MTLNLHTISPKQGSTKEKKRIGRGLGSKGTYSGRGVKGQRARSGGRAGLQLKGIRGIMLSTPKLRGFTSGYPKSQTVSVGTVSKFFKTDAKINPKSLFIAGLIGSKKYPVKILGDGEISISVIVEGCGVSALAKQKIEAVGGRIEILK
jgi:large subunit ribosomal protein L15